MAKKRVLVCVDLKSNLKKCSMKKFHALGKTSGQTGQSLYPCVCALTHMHMCVCVLSFYQPLFSHSYLSIPVLIVAATNHLRLDNDYPWLINYHNPEHDRTTCMHAC